LKWLMVESAYRLSRLRGIVEFDKGHAARLPGFPIHREMDERQGADGREILPQLGFSGLLGKIPHKQSHR
jgi:hypothetical protein